MPRDMSTASDIDRLLAHAERRLGLNTVGFNLSEASPDERLIADLYTALASFFPAVSKTPTPQPFEMFRPSDIGTVVEVEFHDSGTTFQQGPITVAGTLMSYASTVTYNNPTVEFRFPNMPNAAYCARADSLKITRKAVQ